VAVSVWGKILGGVAGFAMGGPMGAVLGAALGHAADNKGGPGVTGASPADLLGPPDPLRMTEIAAMMGSRDTVFSIAVVVLAAKLAKVDGPVKRAEIDAFKRLFRFAPENAKDIAKLWDGARDSPGGYEPFADKLSEAFADNRTVLEEVLASLFAVARADGPLNAAEERFLAGVRQRFSLSERAWESARSGNTARVEPQGPDPYEVLGVARSASDTEIRAAWRQLMRENHPDTLAARGVPPEFVAKAHDKVARINAAWDRIKRERGL
jgi:DnaJ like chaperone protein